MARTTRAKIGFITASGANSVHFDSFRPLIPSDVEIQFKGLDIPRETLYEAGDRTERALEAARQVEQGGAQGIVVSGAPLEVLNPQLAEQLGAAVRVPITTAMSACVAALRALGTPRVLLMTPFNDSMNQGIRQHLANRGIEATSPAKGFLRIDDAIGLDSEEVRRLAMDALKDAGNVDAVYFQGAVLDPVKVMDRIEQDSGKPVVASNPSMLWYILSRLGLTYHIDGYGRLVREWPALPA
jgi:maleate isomerase